MELFHIDADYCTLILGVFPSRWSPMLGSMWAGP